MGRRADNATIVEFPPPFSEGQKEWFQRLGVQLRARLPEDQVEAQAVLAIVKDVVERRSCGQQAWDRAQRAADLLTLFPEDYRWTRQIVSLLSCPVDGEDKLS